MDPGSLVAWAWAVSIRTVKDILEKCIFSCYQPVCVCCLWVYEFVGFFVCHEICPQKHSYFEINLDIILLHHALNPGYLDPFIRSGFGYLNGIHFRGSKLVENPTQSSSNFSLTERETLKSLQKRFDIIIHRPDKGGKIVVMDKDVYINNCKYQLDNEELFTKIDHAPTENKCENIESEISKMVEK